MTGAETVAAAVAVATLHGCIGLAPDGEPQDGVGAGCIAGAALGATASMPTRSARRHCSRGPASWSATAATRPVATITPRRAAPLCARRTDPGRAKRRRWEASRLVMGVRGGGR